MKKLLKLVLLVGLFISVSSSDLFSQTITNDTDCDFRVRVYYSAPNCDVDPVNVPANSVVTVQHKINTATGYPIQLSFGPICPFEVSNGECTLPVVSSVTPVCGPGTCSGYTASLNFATGNLLIN